MATHVKKEIPENTNNYAGTKVTGGFSFLELPHEGEGLIFKFGQI
jgi:hypothetical protein